MARTIAEIQQSIIDAKNADSALSGLTSTSNVAVWRLWTYIVAVAMWTLEKLFDAHKNEVSSIIAGMKPHTLRWYEWKARAYQHGDELPFGSDTYTSVNKSRQIVSFAKAFEYDVTSKVRIKVAKLVGTSLAPLEEVERSGVEYYMKQVRDAGVRVQVTSGNADRLALDLTIYYDALVLDATGARLDGTNNAPVRDAINTYLANLGTTSFGGLLVLASLVDVLQKVDGIFIPHINSASACKGAPAVVDFQPFNVEYLPDSGYISMAPGNLTINYIPHEPI